MKIIALSDLHGNLPIIREDEWADVVCVCGDIVPTNIQNSMIKSISWFHQRFVPWCNGIHCDRVIFVGGNHDFFLPKIVSYLNNGKASKIELEDVASDMINEYLLLEGTKVVYLQDNEYVYKGVKFYGTPWIPELSRWAFYKDDDSLKDAYEKIPNDVDVLLTHSPGRYVLDTGVSLQKYNRPEYGSSVLTEVLVEKNPKYWFCGHVHSGNHRLEYWGDTKVANVSVLDENYDVAYEPLVVEI